MSDIPITTAKFPRHCISCGAPAGAHLSWCPHLHLPSGIVSQPLYATPPDDREVMRRALEALDELTRHASSDGPDMKPHRRAADALREALGEHA